MSTTYRNLSYRCPMPRCGNFVRYVSSPRWSGYECASGDRNHLGRDWAPPGHKPGSKS